MEESNVKSGTLGVVSFVVSIMGFMTSFFFIGAIFDIAALIIGIVALVNKNNKKGFAIAAIIISLIGLLIVIASAVYIFYFMNMQSVPVPRVDM